MTAPKRKYLIREYKNGIGVSRFTASERISYLGFKYWRELHEIARQVYFYDTELGIAEFATFDLAAKYCAEHAHDLATYTRTCVSRKVIDV